jgi:hypothetical protein
MCTGHGAPPSSCQEAAANFLSLSLTTSLMRGLSLLPGQLPHPGYSYVSEPLGTQAEALDAVSLGPPPLSSPRTDTQTTWLSPSYSFVPDRGSCDVCGSAPLLSLGSCLCADLSFPTCAGGANQPLYFLVLDTAFWVSQEPHMRGWRGSMAGHVVLWTILFPSARLNFIYWGSTAPLLPP